VKQGEFDTRLVYDRHSNMDDAGNMHVVGMWYFAVWQSWNAQGDYPSAEIAEAAGRRFCEKYSPVGLLLIGQWQHVVAAGDPVKSISLRKERAESEASRPAPKARRKGGR